MFTGKYGEIQKEVYLNIAKPLYHGTNTDFNIFDFTKAGKNGKAEGFGFYFSDDTEPRESFLSCFLTIGAFADILRMNPNLVSPKGTCIPQA